MQELSSTPSPTVSSYYGTTPRTVLTQSSPDVATQISIESPNVAGSDQSSYRTSDPKNEDDNVIAHSSDGADLSDVLGPLSGCTIQPDPIKLSATAIPFTPRTMNAAPWPTSSTRNGGPIATVHETRITDPFLNILYQQPARIGSRPVNDSTQFQPVSSRQTILKTCGSVEPATVDLGNATRYIKIEGVPFDLNAELLSRILNNGTFTPPSLVVLTKLSTHGTIFLHFPDIRDARAAFVELRQFQPLWHLVFINRNRFVDVHQPQGPLMDAAEGRVVAKAICDGPRQAFDVRQVCTMVQEFLNSFGELLSWSICSADFPRLEIQVEYYDTTAAKLALYTNPFKQAGVTLTLSAPMDRMNDARNAEDSQRPLPNYQGVRNLQSSLNSSASCPSIQPSRMNEVDLLQDSILQPEPVRSLSLPNQIVGGQMSLMPDMKTIGGFGDHESRRCRREQMDVALQPMARPSRGQSTRVFRRQIESPAGSHNVVDIDRIRQGLDVRTTVMLRNIPNKITQAMLKNILDETSHGKYDFMYLRIDFANNCNVGYAFINFEDPWHIVDFVQTRAGRRWNCFNSDKVAEVSYATIQGKDCLIQKFRNSSVMMEHPTFRPKIFSTGDGPDAGQEETFPGPDNTSKMRRSVENAEHVGLFAPRGSHQYRDEQWRRGSQYDRGTHHVESEGTANLESHLQPMMRLPTGYPLQRSHFATSGRHRLERYMDSFNR